MVLELSWVRNHSENFIKTMDPDIFHPKNPHITFCKQFHRVCRSQVKKPDVQYAFSNVMKLQPDVTFCPRRPHLRTQWKVKHRRCSWEGSLSKLPKWGVEENPENSEVKPEVKSKLWQQLATAHVTLGTWVLVLSRVKRQRSSQDCCNEHI